MQRYVIAGVVRRVDYKKINGFQSFDLETAQGPCHVKFNFPLFIRYDDRLSGIVTAIGDNLILDKEPGPDVNIPNNDDSVYGCLRTAINARNLDKNVVPHIVKCLRKQVQPGESLCECIDRLAQSYFKDKDESLVNIFDGGYNITINSSELSDIGRKFYKWWLNNRCLRKLYLLGINKREIRQSGNDPVALYQKCLRNPYTIVSVELKKCEDICRRVGKVASSNEIRSGEILRFLWQYCHERGHMFVDKDYLTLNFPDLATQRALLESEYDIVFDRDRVYLSSFLSDEMDVERFIKRLMRKDKNPFENLVVDESRSPDQQEAIKNALLNRISIVTGEAGTGKTSCLEEMCLLLEQNHVPYVVGAFMGKAVSRIREKTGRMNAKTLHRMIKDHRTRQMIHKVEGRELTESERKILESEDPEVLIIDEASMVTISLFAEVIRNLRSIESVILIGDNNQLPPIGAGALFEQLLLSKRIPTFRLTQNFRIQNAEGELNGVINNAKAIIERKPRETFTYREGKNFYVSAGSLNEIKAMINSYYDAKVDMSKLIFLCPYNEPICELNKYAQEIFSRGKESIVDSRGNKWAIDDPVIMTENDAEIDVFNGESGVVKEIHEKKIVVSFGYGRVHEFPLEPEEDPEQGNFFEEDNVEDYQRTVKKLQLAYALTVHKSQGSEWENVIFFIPPGKKAGPFLNGRLIYTAWTRTRGGILNLCDPTLLAQSAAARASKRNDYLSERLTDLPKLYEDDLIADPAEFVDMSCNDDWQDEVDLDF